MCFFLEHAIQRSSAPNPEMRRITPKLNNWGLHYALQKKKSKKKVKLDQFERNKNVFLSLISTCLSSRMNALA